MSAYDASGYPPFAVTADLVVLTIRAGVFSVLLVRRGGTHLPGRWALPGGFTQVQEDIQDAAYRELSEECDIGRGDVVLEQLRTYGAPGRDKRMRVVTVAWIALGADLPEPTAGSDAAGARWWPVTEALDLDLAFDHRQILADGVERARAKLEYSTLAAAFLAEEFSIAQLRGVYEAVWGQRLDPSNFHRKVRRTSDFVVPLGRQVQTGPGRPARLYRRGNVEVLHPPIRRES